MKKTEMCKAITEIYSRSNEDPSEYMGEITTQIHPDGFGNLEIKISNTYDCINISYAILKEISALVGSEHINVGEKDFKSGCETCDHGSEHSIKIYVKNAKLYENN